METIVSIVGLVTGILSIAGVVYVLGVWKGRFETKLLNLQKANEDYPPAEIALMTKTLWDIVVVDALRSRPDLAERGSGYRLKKEGEDLIPTDLRDELSSLVLSSRSAKVSVTGWELVKVLGMERVQNFAEEKGLSVQEAIAVLATYAENNAGA